MPVMCTKSFVYDFHFIMHLKRAQVRQRTDAKGLATKFSTKKVGSTFGIGTK